jgi:hypothetical protein
LPGIEEFWNKRGFRAIRLTVCWLLLCWSIVALGRNVARMDGWRDHGLFYYAPRLFLHSRDAYDWDVMKTEWRNDGRPTGIDPGTTMSGYVTPPSMALLTLVPSLAPPRFGYRAVDLWNVAALTVSLIFLLGMARRTWPLEARLLFTAFVLTLPDVFGVLLLGQTTLIICACLCASLYCFTSARAAAYGGVGIGLALAKFTLALPFLALLAFRRKWRALLVAILVFLGINLAMSIPGGVGKTLAEFRAAMVRENRAGTSYDPISSNATYMPDTLVHGKRLLYLVFGERRALIEALNILLSVFIVAIMIYVLRARQRSASLIEEPLEIALLTMASLLLFYHRTYDMAALILVGYALVDEGMRGPKRRTTAWVAMVAIFLFVTHSATVIYGLAAWMPHGVNVPSLLCWCNCTMLAALFLLCAFRLHRIRQENTTKGESPGAPGISS